MRTQQQIDRQINGLLEIKKTLPQRSMFGDPNWAGIDAQIEILKGNKTDEDFEDEHEFVFGQARDAQDWLNCDENGDLFD